MQTFFALLRYYMLVILYVVLPSVSHAAGLVPCDGPDCDFLKLVELAQNIINFFVMIVPFVAAIMFAYGGFLYFTAAGNNGQISKAHKIFSNAAIGLLLTLAAWLIIYTILKGLGVTDGGFWFLAQ